MRLIYILVARTIFFPWLQFMQSSSHATLHNFANFLHSFFYFRDISYSRDYSFFFVLPRPYRCTWALFSSIFELCSKQRTNFSKLISEFYLSVLIWKSEKIWSIFTAAYTASESFASDTAATASYHSYSAFVCGAGNFTILPRAEINVWKVYIFVFLSESWIQWQWILVWFPLAQFWVCCDLVPQQNYQKENLEKIVNN